MRCASLFLILTFFSGKSHAQLTAFPCSPLHLPARAFTADDGLGGATITSLVKDSRGFLWVGTPDELLLYDGARFQPFRYRDAGRGGTATPFRRAVVLAAGARHLLIFHEAGVHQYEQASGYLHSVPAPLPSVVVGSTATLSPEDGYAGWHRLTSSSLTARYNPLIRHWQDAKQLTYQLHNAWMLRSGKYMMLASDTGDDGHTLHALHPGTRRVLRSWSAPFRINAAAWLPTGAFLISGGVPAQLWWMPDSGRLSPLPSLRTFSFSAQVTDAGGGVFYVASGQVLLRFVPARGQVEELLDEGGRPLVGKGIINHLLLDGRTLWVGTNASGLLRVSLEGHRFQHVRSTVAAHNFTHAIYPHLAAGRLYVGTYYGNVVVYDTSGALLENLTPMLHRAGGASGYINAIEPLPDGSLFILSGTNPWLFNPGTRSVVTLAESADAALKSEGLDPKDYVGRKGVARIGPWEWWMSDKAGLMRWRLVPAQGGDQARLELQQVIHLAPPSPEAIASYAGGWWCATTGKLFRVDEYGVRDSFALPLSAFVTRMQADAQGRLWIATESGIIVWRGGKAERILTVESGLPNNHVYALLPDSAGWMWGSSNGGLFAVRTSDFFVRAFTGGDGLQGAEFNLGAAARDSRGRLYFGGMNGVNIVEPVTALREDEAGNVTFTRIAGADTVYYTYPGAANLPAFRVPHDRAGVQIAYTVPQLASSGPQQYEYRLKENDSVWTDNGSRTELQLYLAPGNYQVEVRLRGNPASSAAFRVDVAPPFYRTWWAIALLVLGGSAVIAITIMRANRRRYLRQLHALETARRIQQEKERISRELHDELGARAALLSHNASLLRESAGSSEALASLAARVTETTADMLTALRETVWTLKQEEVSVESLWLRYKNFIAKLAATYGHIHFAVGEDDTLPKGPLDYARALHLLRILQEATMNAIKHSGATVIKASVRVEENFVRFAVVDDGRGFDLETERAEGEGNGLHNMVERSAEGRLGLEIKGGHDRGMTVEVVLETTEG